MECVFHPSDLVITTGKTISSPAKPEYLYFSQKKQLGLWLVERGDYRGWDPETLIWC